MRSTAFLRRRITQSGKPFRAVVTSNQELIPGSSRCISPRFEQYEEAQAWADDLVSRARSRRGYEDQEILVVIEQRR